MLRAVDVSFAYGRSGRGAAITRPPSPGTEVSSPVAVLHGVSMELRRGDVLGILGPNGSGKTTLLRLLSGTRQPVSGDVLLDGRPIRHLPRKTMAQRVAVVPQETQLAYDYTCMEMVLMGRHPHLGVFQLEGPRDIEVARNALRATGTTSLENRQFNTLSGGEKQRVVIAAALAQASEVLLLDEPTASLDLAYQLEIAALVKALNRDQGVTIAISTHDLNLAAAVCQQLVLLRAGRIVASGPTADVLTPANIRELYGVAADVRFHPESGHLIVIPIGKADPRA